MNFLEKLANYLNLKTNPKPEPIVNPPSVPVDVSAELLKAYNDERSSRNIGKLRLNNKLEKAALKHAKWMNDGNASHIGTGGTSVADRVKREGYRPRTVGENIAIGYTSIPSVMSGWMASSSGHRRNILGISYTDAGFAKVGNYWCAILASYGDTLSEEIIISYGGTLNAPLCG